MRRHLIAYDVSCASARNAIARRLEKSGRRIQKSVFFVEMGTSALQKLERELQSLLNERDSLLILPVCANCCAEGRLYGPLPPLFIVA